MRNKLANMYGPGGMTKAFRRFDADHDGSVSMAEFRKGMSDLGYGADARILDAICDSVDVDKSGNINYTEFARSLAEIDTEVRDNFGRGNAAALRTNHGRGAGKGAIASDAKDYAGRAHMRMESQDRTAALRAAQRVREKRLSPSTLRLLRQVRSKISDVYGQNGMTKAFRSFDKNHDGSIEVQEFRQGLINLGFGSDREALNAICRSADVDGSGEVDVTEFARTLAEIDTDLRERFGAGDAAARRDNHGRRTSVDMGRDEYDHALDKDLAARRKNLRASQNRLLDDFMGKLGQKYGGHTMLRAFRQFDTDRSGTLSVDEFRAGLQSLGFNPNSGDALAICNVIDADHDGELEFEEFAKRLGQREEGIRGNFERGESSRNVVTGAKGKERAERDRKHFAEKMRSVSLRRHELSKRENRMLDALMQKLNMRFGRSGMTAAFRMFDKDKSGSITVQEFQKSLHELGMHWSKGDIQKIATFVDGDSSGIINYGEFASALKERDQAMSADDEIAYVHRRRKRDASNATIGAARLNKKQFGALERFMEKLEQRFGQSNWRGAFRTFDYDKDGQITRDEFERGVKDIGYDPELPEVRAVADLATSDDTGEIDYAGFAKTMDRIQKEIFTAKGLANSKYAAQAVSREGRGRGEGGGGRTGQRFVLTADAPLQSRNG